MEKIAKITDIRGYLLSAFFDWVIVEVLTDAGITDGEKPLPIAELLVQL